MAGQLHLTHCGSFPDVSAEKQTPFQEPLYLRLVTILRPYPPLPGVFVVLFRGGFIPSTGHTLGREHSCPTLHRLKSSMAPDAQCLLIELDTNAVWFPFEAKNGPPPPRVAGSERVPPRAPSQRASCHLRPSPPGLRRRSGNPTPGRSPPDARLLAAVATA